MNTIILIIFGCVAFFLLMAVIQVILLLIEFAKDVIVGTMAYIREKRLTQKYGHQNPNGAPREWIDKLNK